MLCAAMVEVRHSEHGHGRPWEVHVLRYWLGMKGVALHTKRKVVWCSGMFGCVQCAMFGVARWSIRGWSYPKSMKRHYSLERYARVFAQEPNGRAQIAEGQSTSDLMLRRLLAYVACQRCVLRFPQSSLLCRHCESRRRWGEKALDGQGQNTFDHVKRALAVL